MKKLMLSIFALVITLSAFAQNNSTAQKATDELVKVYDLDADQAKEMLVIQERKVRNLKQISGMKTTEVKKYRHKHRAIQQSTDASIRRMLTEEQMKVYEKRRMELREKRAAEVTKLKESGKTLEEIEDTLIEKGY